jgi:predicted kinase
MRAALLITHGFSGSGKSLVCDRLLEPLGAIHIRSDIERKRPAGLEAGHRAVPAADQYAQAARNRTYRRLARIALQALAADVSVLVDATFLQHRQRMRFRRLARRLGVPFGILAISADQPLLQARIAARAAAGIDPSDADQAVLLSQLQTYERLQQHETAGLVNIDNSAGGLHTADMLVALIRRVLPGLPPSSSAALPTKQDNG